MLEVRQAGSKTSPSYFWPLASRDIRCRQTRSESRSGRSFYRVSEPGKDPRPEEDFPPVNSGVLQRRTCDNSPTASYIHCSDRAGHGMTQLEAACWSIPQHSVHVCIDVMIPAIPSATPLNTACQLHVWHVACSALDVEYMTSMHGWQCSMPPRRL